MTRHSSLRHTRPLIACASLLALLSGCHKKPAPPEVRPVRSVVVQPQDGAQGEWLSGQVAAHKSVALSFRVPGKIVARMVDTGSAVHAGQVLAQLDNTVAEQTLRAATADAQAASAALAQATPLRKRATALLPVKAISRNDYDEVIRRYKTAQDVVQATQARARIAREELDHTTLRADTDGLITERLAEVGEVVAAGQPVLRMAGNTGRDAVFDMPAELVRAGLATGTALSVCLDADRRICTGAQLYELAPDADLLTRTYRAKALLQAPPPTMALGAVVVGHIMHTTTPAIHLPPTALTTQAGHPAVWVVDPASTTVSLRPVSIASYGTQDVAIAAGLKPGERVVTAGVQALYPNQKVALLDDADVRP
ncbi:efflux RND transporter periplasmic adaptor subunit [Acetobacter lambici]|uniref:Efflux RND transporter periplasmic adaptor subunit n=1 Tax=Acetobacter lambici TaxID=1332824 RepID=A0ABT1F4Q4_9PROT|nr:efflux RND transporter periplasmic adaptor subunit [Acetobacter lambici]MCP1242941.1 efflux RND transporter periplasmic adaptor subunit [Acetobacter lambici]MCP1259108.1 efflux RND transporter periplasmic adaptor subunit [Acetobacter lambici]